MSPILVACGPYFGGGRVASLRGATRLVVRCDGSARPVPAPEPAGVFRYFDIPANCLIASLGGYQNGKLHLSTTA